MSSTDRLSAALIATARQSLNTTNLGSERASFFPQTFDKFPQTGPKSSWLRKHTLTTPILFHEYW